MSANPGASKMPLSQEETDFYQKSLDMARRQLGEIDEHIERELAEVRERIDALQAKRQNILKMYDAACTMLGIENEHKE